MKNILIITLIASMSVVLSSCTLLTANKVKAACANAPYVYSNLSAPSQPVTYHLTTGQACPSSHGGFLI